jgi:hypothetical protein
MHEYHMFVLEEDDVRGYLSEVKGEGIIKAPLIWSSANTREEARREIALLVRPEKLIPFRNRPGS